MNQSWPREPQGQELEDLIQLFKALGDPSRMKVLFQIGFSEACVSEVAGKLNMSESAVSHHLHPDDGKRKKPSSSRLIIMQAPPAQFATKRGANPGSSKVRYFKKLLLCSSVCRL